MDYIKEYKSFVNSYYLTEGLRITSGVVLPAVVLSYFNLLSVGVVVSLGALCVSMTDNPGPIHHRRNGMTVCLGIIFLVALLTGYAASHEIWLGVLITIFCFIFSMLGVYGSRANSIGVAALIVMVLNISKGSSAKDVVPHAAYILTGGVWYMLLSLALYSFRPYKLAQQALGDCILATSDYLRVRALFYNKEVNYENTYSKMLEQQIAVHEKQNLVRELLFKTRDIVRESTNTGRILVMIFLDTVDLFERAITSYHDYKTLHDYFNDTDILQRFGETILAASNELDDIGIAVKSGRSSRSSDALKQHIKNLQDDFEKLRDEKRTSENVEGFITLRQILNSLHDIANRIYTLHSYTTYDKKLSKKLPENLEYDKFVSHQDLDPKIFFDNLSLKSNTFRHALRVSIATLAGYIISKFLPVGHSYWILLTIIVILKPAYSLTKKRNYYRVLGTIMGALIGLLILYFIHDDTVLFVIMLLLMVGTYSFLRTNYMIAVLLMTPYILLLFHLLYSGKFQPIILDRVIDTGIGSVIAFLANFLLVPAWEHEQIKNYMAEAIESNMNYFKEIAGAFTGATFSVTYYKLSRKNAFVALANLSDAFTRMLSEPKSKQKNSKLIHQSVVLNHILTSHIATLSTYVKPFAQKYKSTDFIPVINNTVAQLKDAKAIVNKEPVNEAAAKKDQQYIPDKRVTELLEKRREELRHGFTETETKKILSELKSIVDQFNFISKIADDTKKICLQLEDAEEE